MWIHRQCLLEGIIKVQRGSIRHAEAEGQVPSLELDGELSRVVKGAGITFIGKAVSTGLKYLTHIVIARFLGVKLFGLYTLGIAIYQLGELLSGMGLQNGAMRYVSIHHGAGDERRLKGVLLQAIGLPLFGGLILSIALFLGADSVACEIFGKPDLALSLRFFAAAIPFGASMTVTALATTGSQTTRYLVCVRELFQPLVNLVLIAVLCTIGFGLYGVALAWILSTILGLVAAIYSVLRVFPAVMRKDIKPIFEGRRLLKFSLPLAFGEFVWFILLWTDIFMLGYFRPAADVGVYRAASQTAVLTTLFLTSLNTIFAPMIADLHNRKEVEKMRQVFKITTRWSFSLTLPLFLIVGVASQDILRIFGPEFATGWLPLIILSAGQLVNAGTGGVGYMLIMSGHQYSKFLGDLIMAIANVLLNIILIPRWGLFGAAAAMAISIGGVNLLRAGQVYIILRVHAYNRGYLKLIGAGILAALGGFIVRHWLPPMHFFLSLMVTAGVVFLVYVIVLLRGMHLDEADKIILWKIWKRAELLWA